MGKTSTDRIEKQIVLKARRSRVWKALTDSKEFGTWFRAEIQDAFRPGASARGRILYPGYEHLTFEIEIERMEPE
ncbi:MAG TPA: SRPBCC domain-containing protein, partial [Vicinamibacteria bacterium]